ncbi:MAG: MFS transporter [Cyanobacteriota bacterium]
MRELVLVRLIASLGAGGVLYLTPMVFQQEAFSATSVGSGLALAALAGTLGRFISGVLLDRGLACSLPVLLAIGFAVGGDVTLSVATGLGPYLLGQVLLGVAMGLYWPAIELAVPLCAGPIPSARGFALVRSADALGIAAGALFGALLAQSGHLRGIYIVDLLGLSLMALLLLRRPLPASAHRAGDHGRDTPWQRWIPALLPMLMITVLATGLPALMQSALPIDLLRGSLERQALSTGPGALLIGLQLGLLLLLQWPVGQALARRPVRVGLALSLLCFAGGSLLLSLSSFSRSGVLLVIAAQLPLALGEAAFLPLATEAVVELTPAEHQGLGMALFSQCFAISALVAPLAAGRLLDLQGHGAGLWAIVAGLCLLGLLLVPLIRPPQPAGGVG